MVAASIVDVAAKAGVSPATVSRALRGYAFVSEQTRARVRAAADELGYVPSRSASSLATGRTGSVAVVSPYVARWFFAGVIEAAEGELRKHGYDLLLHVLTEPGRGRLALDPDALRKRVDAVLLLNQPLSDAELADLRDLGYPVCVLGAAVDGFASVRIDDVAAARTATEHLVGLGHKRIAHIGDRLPRDGFRFLTPRHRRQGWRDALRAAGLPAERSLDLHGGFRPEGGYAAMTRLLEDRRPPTAVFADSDEMALGAMQAIRERGLRIPEDISVVGIDDIDLAGVVGLTTVAQSLPEQGRAAVEMLLAAVEGRRELWGDVVVPTELLVRESTAPPPNGTTRRRTPLRAAP